MTLSLRLMSVNEWIGLHESGWRSREICWSVVNSYYFGFTRRIREYIYVECGRRNWSLKNIRNFTYFLVWFYPVVDIPTNFKKLFSFFKKNSNRNWSVLKTKCYLLWCVYNPVMWPCPVHCKIGHFAPSVNDYWKLLDVWNKYICSKSMAGINIKILEQKNTSKLRMEIMQNISKSNSFWIFFFS